jgi:hypothetical protein
MTEDSVRTVHIGDGWTIDVPTSFVDEREDDNALVMWDARRTIRLKTLSMSGRPDGIPIAAEELADSAADAYRIEREDDLILELPPQREEMIEEQRVFTVPARAIAPNVILLASFTRSRRRTRRGRAQQQSRFDAPDQRAPPDF